MKRTILFSAFVFLLGFGLQAAVTVPAGVDPTGTWTYKAPTAPEGYGSGDIVIARDKEVYTASLKFGDYVIKGSGVKFEKDVLTFQVYLEGEYISIKAAFSSAGIKGTANYSMGEIAFTGTKKVQKK
jgi:hypothetical protein